MPAALKPVKNSTLPFRRRRSARVLGVLRGAALLAVISVGADAIVRHRPALAASTLGASQSALTTPGAASPSLARSNSSGDGFPDSARLASAQDRENFTRWFTFLAETLYYAPTSRTQAEVQDCAALVRYAFQNSLVAHSPAWRHEAGLPYDPGFGDIVNYHYPNGPLGAALFRTGPGSAAAGVPEPGAFQEFADSATLLRYNTYRISRDVRAAQPGDLLFFHQPVQREPFHTMLFVGRSYYQPQGANWVVYHTGDVNGHRGEIREVQVETLVEHPDLHWRPLLSNPNFLGVYRLEILR